MNISRVFISFLLFSILIFSQSEENLNGNSSNAYGAPIVKVGKINDDTAVFVGGKAGFIFKGDFTFGLAGYGLASKLKVPNENYYNNINISYAGLLSEYTPYSDNLIYLNAEALIGFGSVGMSKNKYIKENNSSIFVFEPALNIILNIHNNFRINIGSSYRYASGNNLPGFNISDLKGINYHLSAMIGIF